MPISRYVPSYDVLLETSAVITTVIQFLSGALVCKKYLQKKSTGDSSGFPFLCGFLSCSLWFRYGLLSDERSLQFVNFIGSVLFLSYSCLYYVVTVYKQSHLRQCALVASLLLAVLWYISCIEDDDHALAVKTLGTVCCIVTVCFFAAPLTSLVHVVRLQNAESLPLPLISMSFLVSIQWLIYGIIVDDTFIQIPNFLGCLLSMLQLFLFVIYPPRSFPGASYRLVVDQAAAFKT